VTEQQNTLTSKRAASYLGVSEGALRLWRSRGEGPRYFRAGDKLIRYRRTDLDSWIEARLSEPNAQITVRKGLEEATAG
jgi:excisionase family DNA binding protein